MSTVIASPVPPHFTTQEIINERQYVDDEKRQREYYEEEEDDDDVQNLQEEEEEEEEGEEEEEIKEVEEAHQELYQPVASSSTSNIELPPVIPRTPRLDKNGVPITYSRLSERYTFSFSADLIAQFDNYRTHMRESIRQELNDDDQMIEEEPENSEEKFMIHQVYHEPAGSVHSNSQTSREINARDRTTNNVSKPVNPSSKRDRFKKYLGISFLRGILSKHHDSTKHQDRNVTTTTTTISDITTLSSDIDQHQQQQPDITNHVNVDEEKSKKSKAKAYIFKFTHLFKK